MDHGASSFRLFSKVLNLSRQTAFFRSIRVASAGVGLLDKIWNGLESSANRRTKIFLNKIGECQNVGRQMAPFGSWISSGDMYGNAFTAVCESSVMDDSRPSNSSSSSAIFATPKSVIFTTSNHGETENRYVTGLQISMEYLSVMCRS